MIACSVLFLSKTTAHLKLILVCTFNVVKRRNKGLKLLLCSLNPGTTSSMIDAKPFSDGKDMKTDPALCQSLDS